MKKILFMVLTCMALTSCSNNEENILKEDLLIKNMLKDVEIVVKGNYVLAPEWIDRVRQDIAIDHKSWGLSVVGYTAEYDGETVIYFEDWLSSSWSFDTDVYTLSGKKLEERVDRMDMTNHKIFCPAALVGTEE